MDAQGESLDFFLIRRCKLKNLYDTGRCINKEGGGQRERERERETEREREGKEYNVYQYSYI